MSSRLFFAALLALISTSLPVHAANTQFEQVFASRQTVEKKIVLGRIEFVTLPGITELSGIALPAKIDTGADSTSIHATNIKITATDPEFDGLSGEALLNTIASHYDALNTTALRDRDDKTNIMVTFDLTNPINGDTITLTKPLFRLAMIKSRGDGHLARPVIKLKLDIAGTTVDTEVNLANRSRFSYPILVGKTFLKQTAWVDAGFNYLQAQHNAKLIGSKEQAKINDIPVNVSISFKNRYSILHAKKVKIDKHKQTVTFQLTGRNKQFQSLTLPIDRMLTFKDGQRPLVYVPVTMGNHTYLIQAYLRDRSKYSSQLRLGTEALSQHFMVHLGKQNLSKKPLELAISAAKEKSTLQISAQENLTIDGSQYQAIPSTTIKTPLLNVNRIDEKRNEFGEQVSYRTTDIHGRVKNIEKPLKHKLRIGKEIRPVVGAEIKLPDNLLLKDIALSAEHEHTGYSEFEISPELIPGKIIINTRTTYLLEKTKPVKAGYIEQVKLAGMSFPAKLDTGADISSIHATDIKPFDKDGEKWVTFTYRNTQGDTHTFTKKVLKEMRIKAREGEASKIRLVVPLTVQLGKLKYEVAVNLRDRSRFKYSMILGQNFLQHNIIVSSDKQYILTQSGR